MCAGAIETAQAPRPEPVLCIAGHQAKIHIIREVGLSVGLPAHLLGREPLYMALAERSGARFLEVSDVAILITWQ
jgi:hypothetical protein